jgi:large subunit ribosomal protein L25
MKLAIHNRALGTKGDVNKLRREGGIPAILYGRDKENTPIYVKGEEVAAILRKIQPGQLATTVFELNQGSSTVKAILKDIQYHVVSYQIEHLDFAVLADEALVSVNVPIQIVGAADCVGVKLGGFLRQVLRSVKVSCLPKDIPTGFAIDVRDLGISSAKKISDIEMPAGVKPLAKLEQVAVIVRKKAGK